MEYSDEEKGSALGVRRPNFRSAELKLLRFGLRSRDTGVGTIDHPQRARYDWRPGISTFGCLQLALSTGSLEDWIGTRPAAASVCAKQDNQEQWHTLTFMYGNTAQSMRYHLISYAPLSPQLPQLALLLRSMQHRRSIANNNADNFPDSML